MNRRRIPPVVLLHGARSARLEAEAYVKARQAICPQGGEPAGIPPCPACRRVLERTHPDLLVLAPERSRRVGIAGTPSRESRETTIPADLVRHAAGDASRAPYEAPRRVVVLLDAERTDGAAVSALLKVLEEPPARTRFVLTAARPHALPATILSRAVPERIRGVSRSEVRRRLEASGADPSAAAARTAFEPSDPDAAGALDLDTWRGRRDEILAGLDGVFTRGSVPEALRLAAALSAGDDPSPARRLRLAAELLRDAAAAPADPEGGFVRHVEVYATLRALGGATTAGRLLAAATQALELSVVLDSSPRQPRLACEGLTLRWVG